MLDDLQPRDLAVLRHVGLYRVGVYPVVSHLFFGGNGPTCGIHVKRLAETQGKRPPLIQLHRRALPGRHSYVTLRPAGCAALGVSAKRANPLGTAALNLAIGLAYYCCRGEKRRHRIEREELRSFLGDDTPPDNVFHVASEELGWPCVLRVYQVQRHVEGTIQALRRDLSDARRRPVIASWIDGGDYSAAVLVPWPDKVAKVRETLARSGLADELPLVVGVGPTAETLPAVLKHEG